MAARVWLGVDQPSTYQVLDQLAEMLAARRRERVNRRAAYVELARVIVADETEAADVDQTRVAA